MKFIVLRASDCPICCSAVLTWYRPVYSQGGGSPFVVPPCFRRESINLIQRKKKGKRRCATLFTFAKSPIAIPFLAPLPLVFFGPCLVRARSIQPASCNCEHLVIFELLALQLVHSTDRHVEAWWAVWKKVGMMTFYLQIPENRRQLVPRFAPRLRQISKSPPDEALGRNV